MHQQNFDTLADKVCDLQNQKHQLEQFASRFRNIDKRYIQIKRIAEEVVDRLLKERKSLLTSALVAVVEALRLDPDRCHYLQNKYDNNDSGSIAVLEVPYSSSSSSSPPPYPKPYQNHYYNEYHEGILEIAKTSSIVC
jgi:hypothetical protein